MARPTLPTGLSNVVAVAAGEDDSLALKSDGTVVAWGDNEFGQTNVPLGMSNVMAIAAGDFHSLALKNDGTLVSWGDNTYGETNAILQGSGVAVKLIAAGGDHSMAAIWSPLVQYPIDVSKDLLLIYNTNSLDSFNVCQYYTNNRPMVSNANVLGIGCTNNEIIDPADFTNTIAVPIQNWLATNETKRPAYVILFQDIPSRVESGGIAYPSVQCQINATCATNWHPFVSSINMNGTGGTNDCIAYINKLAFIGSNYSPGHFILSASAGGYGNTHCYFDDTTWDYKGDTFIYPAVASVLSVNTNASITYLCVTLAPAVGTLPGHITNAPHVAGFASWGVHGYYGYTNGGYATNGDIQFTGQSSWYIIETIESFNGQRSTFQGNFLDWYASNAFDGTNYSNTPVGAVSNVEEPGLEGVNNPAMYFGDRAAGRILAYCAWNSFPNVTQYLQVVGDPFTKK